MCLFIYFIALGKDEDDYLIELPRFFHLHLVFADKASGVVKVLNCEIEQIVLDGFAGSIVDVSFANSQDVVLAAADQTGDLRVFRISILPSGRLMYPFH